MWNFKNKIPNIFINSLQDEILLISSYRQKTKKNDKFHISKVKYVKSASACESPGKKSLLPILLI